MEKRAYRKFVLGISIRFTKALYSNQIFKVCVLPCLLTQFLFSAASAQVIVDLRDSDIRHPIIYKQKQISEIASHKDFGRVSWQTGASFDYRHPSCHVYSPVDFSGSTFTKKTSIYNTTFEKPFICKATHFSDTTIYQSVIFKDRVDLSNSTGNGSVFF